MRIVGLSAIPFTLPLSPGRQSQAASSLRPATRVDAALIEVRADDGTVGVAEAPARPQIYGETQRSFVEIVNDFLSVVLLGQDPFDVARIAQLLQPPASPAGNLLAKGAVDMAIHDLICRKLGIPVYKYLGGWLEPPTLDLSVLIPLGSSDDELVADAEYQRSLGFCAFKVKVGKDVRRDVGIVRRIRQVVGDESLIYVDANEAYSFADALDAIGKMAELGVAWVEDPCSVHAPSDVRRRLARRLPIPILGDNSCFTPEAVLRELQDETAGMVLIKTARTGFHQSARIAMMANEFGVPWILGSQGDTAVGTLGAAQLGAGLRSISRQPAEISYMTRYEDQIATVQTCPSLADGTITCPARPGIGVEIDRERLARYTVETRSGDA
jgi:L-Ala-D/L-Glu epimerase